MTTLTLTELMSLIIIPILLIWVITEINLSNKISKNMKETMQILNKVMNEEKKE